MFRDHTPTLNVGSTAPAFNLPLPDGTRCSSRDLVGATSLVFFLRGTWCPNCKRLMQRLDDDWKQFEERAVRIVCIAAQRIDGMAGARRYVETHNHPFPVAFDEDRSVTRAWGVYRPIGLDALHIAHPAVFLLDAGQTIRWIAVSPNQYTRPSTSDIIEKVESLLTGEAARP